MAAGSPFAFLSPALQTSGVAWALQQGTGLAGFPFQHFYLPTSPEHKHDSPSLATILWPSGRGPDTTEPPNPILKPPAPAPPRVKRMNHYMVKPSFEFSVTNSQTQILRHKFLSTALLMHPSQLPPQAGLHRSTFIQSVNNYSQAPILHQGPAQFWATLRNWRETWGESVSRSSEPGDEDEHGSRHNRSLASLRDWLRHRSRYMHQKSRQQPLTQKSSSFLPGGKVSPGTAAQLWGCQGPRLPLSCCSSILGLPRPPGPRCLTSCPYSSQLEGAGENTPFPLRAQPAGCTLHLHSVGQNFITRLSPAAAKSGKRSCLLGSHVLKNPLISIT